MKKLIVSGLLLAAVSPFANAKTVYLEGDAAASFISRHFPDADIPGDVVGVFQYINRHDQQRQGYAECFYPAMGEASNGVVPSCKVEY